MRIGKCLLNRLLYSRRCHASATRFGQRAVELVLAKQFGQMVAFHPPDIVSVPLERVVGRTHNVPVDFDVVRTARAIGISLGD